MTTSHIQYRGPHSSQGLTVGNITNVSPHVGLDRARQVIIEFEHGTLRLGDDQAACLAAEIAGALCYTETTRRPNITYPAPNCSGALADLEANL